MPVVGAVDKVAELALADAEALDKHWATLPGWMAQLRVG